MKSEEDGTTNDEEDITHKNSCNSWTSFRMVASPVVDAALEGRGIMSEFNSNLFSALISLNQVSCQSIVAYLLYLFC